MSIKEKFKAIRKTCNEMESCRDCVYRDLCPSGFPSDWSDDFIEVLASEQERPKARWEFAQMYYLTNSKRYHCSICGTSLLFDENKWHYCPHCGAEMEE